MLVRKVSAVVLFFASLLAVGRVDARRATLPTLNSIEAEIFQLRSSGIEISDRSMVSCSFDGIKSKVGCLLDTGGALHIMPRDIDGESFEDASDISLSSNYEGCKLKKIKSLKIGDVENSANRALYCPESDFGVTSAAALEGRVWEFDFQAHRLMALTHIPENLPRSPLYRSPEGHVGTKFGNRRNPAVGLLDTGSSTTIMDASVVKKFPTYFSAGTQMEEPWPTSDGKRVSVTSYKVTGLEINGKNVDLDKVYVFDFIQVTGTFSTLMNWGVSTVFGRDLLRQQRWYLDLKENTWAFETDTMDRTTR
jgi:hypothetical protein